MRCQFLSLQQSHTERALPGPSNESEQAPAVWVDRSGAKFNLVEQHTGSNRANYGLVLEQITTRDEEGQIVGSSNKINMRTQQEVANGPPTTHSSKGVDRVLLLQGDVVRDDTEWIHETQVGSRAHFSVNTMLPWDQHYHSDACVYHSLCHHLSLYHCIIKTYVLAGCNCCCYSWCNNDADINVLSFGGLCVVIVMSSRNRI